MHKHGRDYYLSDIPLDEAIRKFDRALAGAGALRHTASESVPLDRANGRITAEPVWAERSSPHYDAAAMDGVAVRAADTVGASETSPLKLIVGDQAVWVDTGDPMPRDADAVIMVEDIQETDESTIEIYAPVSPYQHVRALGEDIAAAELVLPQSHKLRPHDLAACAAAGLTEVSVRVPPIVAIIPTGSELAPIGKTPKPGEIIEFNSLMLAAMVEEWGGSATRLSPVPGRFRSPGEGSIRGGLGVGHRGGQRRFVGGRGRLYGKGGFAPGRSWWYTGWQSNPVILSCWGSSTRSRCLGYRATLYRRR